MPIAGQSSVFSAETPSADACNPWPGAPYTCSSNNRIHAFGRIIMEAGIASPIRKTRGEDIMAACGQLKSMSELKKGQKVKLKP